MLNPTGSYFYLLVYVAVMYIRPQEYVPSLQGLPLVPVLLILAFGLWLLLQRKNFEASQHGLMIGLGLAMSLSVAMAGWGTGAVNAFIEFVPTLMLFYLVATSVDSLHRLREMALVLTVAVTVIALHGIGQATSEQGSGWTGATLISGRITYLGQLNDPNDLALVFLMTLPLTLYLARSTASLLLRLGLWASSLTMLYGVYLCNSRGAMVALGAMLLTYGIRRFGLIGSLLASPLLLAPFLLLAPSRISEISADEDSAAGRVDAWYAGFEMFRSHPLFGVGKGMFVDHHDLTAHNSFVLAFAELGLFGYFFWLALLVTSALMLRRLLLPLSPTAEHPLGAAPRANGLLVSPRLHAAGLTATSTVSASAAAAVGAEATTGTMAIGEQDDDEGPESESRPRWADLQNAAAALLYALVGVLVSAFFLSRTYVVFLFQLLALIVAVHGVARKHWPDTVEPVHVGERVVPIVALELASMAVIWVLTRLTLSVA